MTLTPYTENHRFTREEILALLESEWEGREPPRLFPHLATTEFVDIQFDRDTSPLFVGLFTFPTTDEHVAACGTCQEHYTYRNFGSCVVRVICTRT